MNTNSDNKKGKAKMNFQDLLASSTFDEKIELEAQMIQLELVAELRELMKLHNIKSKKELADLLETSPSFITQLFSADKFISLKFLAKLQIIFKTKFSIESDLHKRIIRTKMNFWTSKRKIYESINPEIFETKPCYEKDAA